MAKSMTILIVIKFITTPAPAIPTCLHIEPGLVEGYCVANPMKISTIDTGIPGKIVAKFSIPTPN